jgi:20S proteasome subunit beta 4
MMSAVFSPRRVKMNEWASANILLSRYYCLSLLDKHHHPDIDYEQGLKIMRMCTEELKRRLPIDFKGVFVKVITKDGIKNVDYEDDVKVSVP